MNSVRKITKTTITLIAFPLVIMLIGVLINELTKQKLFNEFHVNVLLSEREELLSPVYLIAQKTGFWSMLIVGIEYAILDERHGIGILGAFKLPIAFMIIMTVVMVLPFLNITQIWAIYFIMLLIFIYLSFTKLYTSTGIKSQLIPFLKNLSNPFFKSNPVDYYVVLVTKLILLVILIAILLLTALYCAESWEALIVMQPENASI